MSENLRAAGKHQGMERKEDLKLGGEAVSLPADLSCLQGVGGAEGEAALATLEKQLICPICLELFNKPVVILPCQHNLCRKCANELYQPSLFQARTTMMINSGRFRCPSCRLEVVLDRHGVYGLPRNLLVENIIDVYKQEVSNYNNKVASSLPAPPAPPAQGTCPDHEGEKVNIYCLSCKVPTCSLCKVFGAHQSCQVAPLSDFFQLQKDELSEEVRSLRAYNDKVRALIDDIEQTCRNIEENSETQKRKVCEQFSHMSAILDERRKAMMEKITSEEEEKTGLTRAVIRCYGDSVEANRKLMERATSSMEEPDMAAFVQCSKELVAKVIAAATVTPSETLRPGHQSLSPFSFNVRRQERALRSVDFPKAVQDVPEEQDTEPEPEPKDTSPQLTDLKQHPQPSIQNLRPAAEPDPEIIPALTAPAQTEAPRPVQADPGLLRVSEEPAGAVLQTETENLDLDQGTGVMKKEEEEEEEEVEKRSAAPDPGKEETRSEEQDGLSTLQREGGGCADDLMKQSQTEEDSEHQDEEGGGGGGGGGIKEEKDAELCPRICKPSSWTEVDQETSRPHPAGDPLPEPQAQSLDPQLPPPGSEPGLRSQEGKGDTEEDEEEEEGRLPGAEDQSLNPEAEGNDPGDPGVSLKLKDVPAEETLPQDEGPSSEVDKDDAEDDEDESEDDEDEAVDPEEKEHLEDDDPDLKCPSALTEGESETTKQQEDEVGFKPQTHVLEAEAAELLVCASGLVENKEDDAENSPSVDLNPQTGVKYVESLQVITLIFYVLAFLVILQRVWAYIGCFICI